MSSWHEQLHDRIERADGPAVIAYWDEGEAAFRFVADFGYGERRASLAVPDSTPLERHLILKMTMNTLSTLVMGRLGRYVDNIMVYVKPANRKLIDRAIRYVRLLAARRLPADQAPDYETVARCLLAEIPRLKPGEPVVLRTLEPMVAPEVKPVSA